MHASLHCLHYGNPHHPAVILLHGFPESSYSWRYQIPSLTNAGFHVLAPDLRGYGLSDKPKKVSDYRVECLVADVLALVDSLAPARPAIVGHDWGGIIAWQLAMCRPQKLSKLIILNAPHPAAYRRQLCRGGQLFRSWYALLFQLPWLPEAVLSFNDFAILKHLYRRGPARNSATPDEDVRHYIEAISQPYALRSAINYYRAAGRDPSGLFGGKVDVIRTPTLLIWGEKDRYLENALTSGLDPWVANLRIERLPSASHWVQHDEPERVNSLLIDFLNRGE